MLTRRRLLALALLAALWALGAAAGHGMAVHMAVHLGVVALVPALVAPRLPVAPGPVLLGTAVLAEMMVVWGWHLPAAHLWARASLAGYVAEQVSFLAVGLGLFAAVGAAGRLGGAVVLLATVMHMTLLGALIGLAPRALYHAPLWDQHLAGALMAVGGGAFYLVAALVLLAPALDERRSDTA
jgi:putative membrane protein